MTEKQRQDLAAYINELTDAGDYLAAAELSKLLNAHMR